MRWNCPHCSTLVNLEIDLDRNPKAYVRCGKCMGIALIQKNANADAESLPNERDLAQGFMSARDALREEQTTLQNSQRGIADHYFQEEENTDTDAESSLHSEIQIEMDGSPVPEVDALRGTSPTRQFRAKTQLPRPPAFLLAATPIQNPASSALYSTFHVDTEAEQRTARVRSIVILALAAVAFVAGIYLFVRGQQAMVSNRLKLERALRKIETAPALDSEVSTVIATTSPSGAPSRAERLATNLRSAANAPANDRIRLESASTLAANHMRVIVPQAILRSAPSTESDALEHLQRDELLTIQSFRGNWIRVEVRNKQGWLRNDLVAVVGQP